MEFYRSQLIVQESELLFWAYKEHIFPFGKMPMSYLPCRITSLLYDIEVAQVIKVVSRCCIVLALDDPCI